MANPMFVSMRKYSGAPTLADELVKKQADVKSILLPIRGFHAYYLIKTSDGAVSMTVCEDRAGADQSNRVASTWLKDKLPQFATCTPEVITGEVQIHLDAQLVKVGV